VSIPLIFHPFIIAALPGSAPLHRTRLKQRLRSSVADTVVRYGMSAEVHFDKSRFGFGGSMRRFCQQFGSRSVNPKSAFNESAQARSSYRSAQEEPLESTEKYMPLHPNVFL
jgi:hypothetical protein